MLRTPSFFVYIYKKENGGAKYTRKLYPHHITVNSIYAVEYPYSTPR